MGKLVTLDNRGTLSVRLPVYTEFCHSMTNTGSNTIHIDGRPDIRLLPGQAVTFLPNLYHIRNMLVNLLSGLKGKKRKGKGGGKRC